MNAEMKKSHDHICKLTDDRKTDTNNMQLNIMKHEEAAAAMIKAADTENVKAYMNAEMKKLHDHICKLTDDRKTDINNMQLNIMKHEEEAKKAAAAMIKAADAENVKAYSEAKALKEAETDLATMYRTKLERLESSEIVTADQASEFCSKVDSLQIEALKKLEDVLKETLPKIADAFRECMPVLYDGDQLYKEYSANIKRLKIQRGTKGDGTPNYIDVVPSALSTISVNNRFEDVTGFANRILADGMYKKITGTEFEKAYAAWYDSRQ